MKYLDIYLENLIRDKNVIIDKEDDYEKVKVSCGVIVKLVEGRPFILLIQRAADDHFPLFFEPPRGKCENKEKIIHCLKREIKEETGLDVNVIKYIDTFSYINTTTKRDSIQYNFLCMMKNPEQEVVLSHEHDSYIWVQSPGEAQLILLPEMKNIINKVLEYFEKK